MAELVDAQDLKSCVGQPTCQFDSGSRQAGLPKGRPFFWPFDRLRDRVPGGVPEPVEGHQKQGVGNGISFIFP